jgi:hypothetical protein
MSPTRSGYKKLGLEPIEPLQDRSRRARQQPMGDEKKDDGAGDPIKMLLEEALARQRNEMMDNFAQILRRLPTGEASSSSGHATPFKVQVNFDIPLFEGLIDVPIFSIPYAPNWVSKTLSVIWCSNTMVVCIDTFKQKWSFWTSPHWARLIDTLSRSSRNLSRKGESLDLQTPHSRSREKAAPTHTTRDQVEMISLRTTSPSRNTRREMRR